MPFQLARSSPTSRRIEIAIASLLVRRAGWSIVHRQRSPIRNQSRQLRRGGAGTDEPKHHAASIAPGTYTLQSI